MVDYTTKYFECNLLRETTSASAITSMKSVFSRHGIPRVLMTDTEPQFVSRDLRKFTSAWEIRHVTSSPLYPQSNGMVERTVQTVKNLLKKAKENGDDPYLAILNFRTTPKQLERSPAQLLMGRKLRTLLPTVYNKIVRPTSVTHAHQQKQASYYNNHTKDLKQLQQLQFVRYRNQRPWEPAQVLQRLGARSYLIKTKNGTYRRNRRDLRETTETFDLSRPDPFEFDVQLPQSATPSTTYATPSTQTESQNSSDQQAETKWQSCETSSKTNTVEKAEPIS